MTFAWLEKFKTNTSRGQRLACYFLLLLICAAIITILIIFIPKHRTTTMMTSIPTDSDTTITEEMTTDTSSFPPETSIDNLLPYWTLHLSLLRPRSNFGAVLLANGNVMACGGRVNSSIVTSSCEFYLPAFGWVSAPSMKTSRYYYTLTPFANKTKVLAVGTLYQGYGQTADVYDSINNTWTSASTNMSTSRNSHTAILLKNEQILIMGGKNSSGSILSAVELFMPSSNSFTNTSSMNIGRTFFTSTLLNDGLTVLVTGGISTYTQYTGTAELYISGSWIFTNNNMTQSRAYHSAVLLNDGNVLIVGGDNGESVSYSTAEIYDSTTRTFRSVQSMKYPRESFTLTLLPSGHVLATGGIDWTTKTYPVTCELYDPITETWSNTRILNNGRSFHRTVLLNDSVLTMGGDNGGNTKLASCEKYYL